MQPLPIVLPPAREDSIFVIFQLGAVISNRLVFLELPLLALEQRASRRRQKLAAFTVLLAPPQHPLAVVNPRIHATFLRLLLCSDRRRPQPIDVLVALQLLFTFLGLYQHFL